MQTWPLWKAQCILTDKLEPCSSDETRSFPCLVKSVSYDKSICSVRNGYALADGNLQDPVLQRHMA